MTDPGIISAELIRAVERLLPADSTTTMGVGVDVQEHVRFRHVKVDALFTPGEQEHCRRWYGRSSGEFAGIWCAKEAVFKALSPFLDVGLRDIEIGHNQTGEPVLRLHIPESMLVECRVRISVSRTSSLAMAVAIYQPDPYSPHRIQACSEDHCKTP
jgi:phosphopantetheine--protein transferase-like protein